LTVTVTVEVDMPSAGMEEGLADTVTPEEPPAKNPSSSTTTLAVAALEGPLSTLTLPPVPVVA
jgi:hypothetical protein